MPLHITLQNFDPYLVNLLDGNCETPSHSKPSISSYPDIDTLASLIDLLSSLQPNHAILQHITISSTSYSTSS
jgi:hypothetical protein